MVWTCNIRTSNDHPGQRMWRNHRTGLGRDPYQIVSRRDSAFVVPWNNLQGFRISARRLTRACCWCSRTTSGSCQTGRPTLEPSDSDGATGQSKIEKRSENIVKDVIVRLLNPISETFLLLQQQQKANFRFILDENIFRHADIAIRHQLGTFKIVKVKNTSFSIKWSVEIRGWKIKVTNQRFATCGNRTGNRSLDRVRRCEAHRSCRRASCGLTCPLFRHGLKQNRRIV